MKSLQGQFLIATPKLLDPNFFHSVILIVEHDENGALGLVLNRPTEMTIAEAWKQVSEMPYPNAALVYQGGPCEGPLMVLHTQAAAGLIQVIPGMYYSTEASSISRLVELDAAPMKFFVGYAGWQAGQLEEELVESAWLVAPATVPQVFSETENLWASLAKSSHRHYVIPNIDPKVIPPDPSYN